MIKQVLESIISETAMSETDLFIVARAVHMAGVVLWIGRVAFVTLMLIPARRRVAEPEQRMALFEELEGRYQGLTGIVFMARGEGEII